MSTSVNVCKISLIIVIIVIIWHVLACSGINVVISHHLSSLSLSLSLSIMLSMYHHCHHCHHIQYYQWSSMNDPPWSSSSSSSSSMLSCSRLMMGRCWSGVLALTGVVDWLIDIRWHRLASTWSGIGLVSSTSLSTCRHVRRCSTSVGGPGHPASATLSTTSTSATTQQHCNNDNAINIINILTTTMYNVIMW